VNGWDELVAAALVGTARRPPPAVPLPAVDVADDPEAGALAGGAALGLYRQAGWRPPVDPGPLPPPSPAEDRPRCSPAAAERLDAILDGRFRPVLREWLALVAAAKQLVPPDRLPALLDLATAAPSVREAALAVIGHRGRWVAALNPPWAWAGAADGTRWTTGSRAARRLLLARIRAEDPDAARALVESTWTTESGEDRAVFVGALASGLSMADEPFLEAALDDRRKEVRQAAAELLWRLPESRLARRMAARARALVGPDLTITLPAEVDPAMVRDGVVAKPPAGTGARAWWLHQVIAATPLDVWPPQAVDHEPPPLLRRAWAAAAVRQGNVPWARALLARGAWAEEPALLSALPHDEAQRVATDLVRRVGLVPAVLDLLDHCPPPWGTDLSRAVVTRVAEAAHQPGRPRGDAATLRARLGDLGARLDPAVDVAGLADVAPGWVDVVGWFLDLLAFRAGMREELLW